MKITIVTPTIREGWWDIMAQNLSQQTYKNFEWLIVDDHEEDRSLISSKYAQKYNLDIKYIKGAKSSVKRKYGLVRANNIAVDNGNGDLFVWLQDFMLIEPTALEDIIRVANNYPMSLIACVDDYKESKIPFNLNNKEDYFDGEVDVLGETMFWPFTQKPYECWRKQGSETRVSENHYEFEMNFCAIPRVILKTLNGWWEFMDDGFGFDNTEFAYRAMKKFKLVVAQNIIGTGIDHTPLEKSGDVKDRYYNFNDPRFDFLNCLTDEGVLPIIRDKKLDDSIQTPYEIPKYFDKETAINFMRSTTRFYVSWWTKLNFPDFYNKIIKE